MLDTNQMIHSLSGKLMAKNPGHAVLETSGIGFVVNISKTAEKQLPEIGSPVRLLCSLAINREGASLYGFIDEREKEIFEALTSINGIGPKGAIKILNAATIDHLLASVENGRADLLMKAAGVGQKKAERIVLELRSAQKDAEKQKDILILEQNSELQKTLKTLGYKEKEIRLALPKIPQESPRLEDRLRSALKILSRR